MFFNYYREKCNQLTDEEVAKMAQEIYDGEGQLRELQAEVRWKREKLSAWFFYHPEALKQRISHGYYSPSIFWTQSQRRWLRRKASALGISESEMAAKVRRSGEIQPSCRIRFNTGGGNRYVPAIKTQTGLIRKAYPWEKPQNDRWGFVL